MKPLPLEGLPLEGIRVVDCCDGKGDLCGRVLADLGADVVKVEPPGGASTRHDPPFTDSDTSGASLSFLVRNANKRGVVIDLASARGRDELRALASGADLLIESFSPGHLASLGIGPDVLLADNPALVVTSITDFGQDGPYADYIGTDMVDLALGGVMCRGGTLDRPPLTAPGMLAYDIAGVTAAFAGLLAHWHRLRTGSGQHVDVSVMESVANCSDWALPTASWLGPGYPQIRAGAGPVYPIFPCKDGFVRVVILTTAQWREMRSWLGEPEMLQEDHWDLLLMRITIGDVLEPLYVELFKDSTMAELCAEGQRRRVAITPVLRPREVLEHPHFVERGTFTRAELAPGVEARVPSGMFEIDGARAGFRHRAPGLDEHDGGVWTGPRVAGGADGGGDPAGLPFAGLRVLDFGIGGVGVETGRLFAEYGADVIKVENGDHPDFIRCITGTESSPSFSSSSRTKRSLGIDVKSPEGHEILLGLARGADVVIENSQKGVMDAMGVGYEALHGCNPRVVMVSSQLLGSRGPASDWMGYGPSTRPIGGLSYLWSHPGSDVPAESSSIHPDHLAGRVGAVGALAALVGRERTGVGCHVEVAQVEVVVGLLGDLFAQEDLRPGTVVPIGNTSAVAAPRGPYPCQGEEQYVVVDVQTDAQWSALVEVMGSPEWATEPAYKSAEGRVAARAVIDGGLAAWTAPQEARAVTERCQARGVPAGVMHYPLTHLEDPHLKARGFLRPIEQPMVGSLTLEGPAFHTSRSAGPRIEPSPRLGEHTREVCTGLLGMRADEIDALVAKGVLEEPS